MSKLIALFRLLKIGGFSVVFVALLFYLITSGTGTRADYGTVEDFAMFVFFGAGIGCAADLMLVLIKAALHPDGDLFTSCASRPHAWTVSRG